jgi:hypothetical protein
MILIQLLYFVSVNVKTDNVYFAAEGNRQGQTDITKANNSDLSLPIENLF